MEKKTKRIKDPVLVMLRYNFCDHICQHQGALTNEPGSSITKDLINSIDPKHSLFCRETAFVAIYALFRGNIPIL